RGNHRGGLADRLTLQHRIAELFGVEFQRGSDRLGFIGQVCAGIEQRLGHRAVDHAGIEVTIAVMTGEPLAERALAGGGRSVDGDDHAHPMLWLYGARGPRRGHLGASTAASRLMFRSPSALPHANAAPSPRIIGMKSGKLVAMKLVSSTRTGRS